MIMTDRFANGDRTNDNFGKGEYLPGNLWYYQGGDWRGIIQHLDYISNLGVTAIWISPVVLNKWEDKPYHGYAAEDFYSPDNHFGTMEDLRELVREAHARGIKVIFDLVLNHTADFQKPGKAEWWNENRKPAPPFDNLDWYHHNGPIVNWEDPKERVLNDLWGLDDLAQEKPEVANELINVGKYWIRETGCDGYRLDATKHMPRDFLERFCSEIGRPCFGESWYGWPDEDFLGDFKVVGSMFDIPFLYAVRNALQWKDASHLHNLLRTYEELEKKGRVDQGRLVRAVSSHDVDRILRAMGWDEDKTRVAYALAFTCRGIPMIYYGDEQGFDGGRDPANREPMFDPKTGEPKYFNENAPMFIYLRRLCDLRRSNPALLKGRQIELFGDKEVYAFARTSETQDLVAVVNVSETVQERIIPLRPTRFPENALLVDLLSENLGFGDLTMVMDGETKEVYVSLPPKRMRVFSLAEKGFLENRLPVGQLSEIVQDTIARYYRLKAGQRRRLYLPILAVFAAVGVVLVCWKLLTRHRARQGPPDEILLHKEEGGQKGKN
jgi:glycosidase